MPMNREKYPADWERIATDLKDQVNWKCEGCGKQCRKPDEPFDTHRRTLTVAHINHVELDCNPGNLICLCAPCHLAYDAPMKRFRRIASKRKPNDSES